MAVEANSEDIKMVHGDVSEKPFGPSEDVEANEAAEGAAKVHEEEENGEMKTPINDFKTEGKLDVDDRGEQSKPSNTENAVDENGKLETMDKGDASPQNAKEKQGAANDVAQTSSFDATEKGDYSKSDESDPLSDLKDNEKEALQEFRSKIEEAILMNKLLKEKQQEHKEESDQKAKSHEELSKKCEPKAQVNLSTEEEKHNNDKGKAIVEEEKEVEIDNGAALCLWGVPLMPSRGDNRTDVILLKFLRARDFKVDGALEMLRSTLQWRKENNIDLILQEDFGSNYDSMSSMSGADRRGNPICYNVYGVFGNEDLYNKTFGTQESREKFLMWRLQLMERQIQKLDFRPGGVSSLLQINDLKDTPGPSRKDLRLATRQAVALLQDNYPEFVARNIFINVPFWYYAFNALLSPFLTQRTKSKFVFARANRVTETLLKYIAGEEIAVKYGGLKRENDPDFSTNDGVSEVIVKAGSTETIEISAAKAGSILVWDLTVIGWEVNYKEEFVPSDETSYTIIVKKERRIGWQEGSVRNTYKNNEPGKVVLTIENGQFRKKRVLYRYKTKDTSLGCSSS